MNPVAYRLAMNNGTQCGYCTVGFVMNMSEFLINHPKATKRESRKHSTATSAAVPATADPHWHEDLRLDWTAEDEAAG